MRMLIILALLATPAAAEPTRWSTDVHDRLGDLARATRLFVDGEAIRVEGEVTDPRTGRYVVRKGTAKTLRGKGLACAVSSTLGTVCAAIPAAGDLMVRLQAEDDACASGEANVGTGD